MSVSTYDPKEVRVIVAGIPLRGFADGSKVEVEQTEDTFSMVTGSDGDVTRVRNNNDSGMIRVRLQQSSSSNTYLSGLHAADKLTGKMVVPVMVKDSLGDSVHFAGSAWLRRPANAGYAKELGTREWTFDCSKLSNHVGGNFMTAPQ
jgi:hypothetical protein